MNPSNRILAPTIAAVACALAIATANCESTPTPTPTETPTPAPTQTQSTPQNDAQTTLTATPSPPTVTPSTTVDTPLIAPTPTPTPSTIVRVTLAPTPTATQTTTAILSTHTPTPSPTSIPIKPTATPDPTPSPTPIPIQTTEPTAIPTPEPPRELIIKAEYNISYSKVLQESGHIAASGLYPVELVVVPHTRHLPQSELPTTVQITCKPANQPARKCTDDWVVDSNASHQEKTFNLELPGGWNEITFLDEGTPVRRAYIGIPSGYPGRSPDAWHRVFTTAVGNFGNFVDAYSRNAGKPPYSNGLVPRVTGYWADSTADVEIFAGSRSVQPNDTITCRRDGEPEALCDAQLSLVPNGKYTRILTRLPFGTTYVNVYRNGLSALKAHVTVSERIVGIDPDVLECITDTSLLNAGFSGTGCSGWFDPYVDSWDPTRPLQVKLIGPTQWTTFFVDTVKALEPLFNIKFEWVYDDRESHVKAVIGITRHSAIEQELACSIEPITAGCASIGPPEAPDDSHHIVIYNTLTFTEDLPTSETQLDFLRHTIVHEAIHAFTGMNHRFETGSIMNGGGNEFYTRRTTPNPMDTALISLQSTLGTGMTFHDIEQMVVPHDELLDAHTEPIEPSLGYFAWKAVNSAFHKIRESATATYEINTSMPGCQQQVSGATYQVAKLIPGSREFQWLKLRSDQLNTLRIDDHTETDYNSETWELIDSTWQTVDHSHETRGWIPELSDPYHLLVDILVRADWSQIYLTKQGSKSIVWATEAAFPTGSGRGSFQLAIDNDTDTITDYQLHWNRSYEGCDGYLVTATNGSYSDRFTFPPAIRSGSELLSGCESKTLPANPRAHRVSGEWYQECPAQMAAAEYSQAYRFETDTWSLLRIDFQAPDDSFLSLTDLSNGETQTLSPSRGRPIPDGLEGYGFRIAGIGTDQLGVQPAGSYVWHHQWLPPGQYEIQAATRERAFPESFTLIVDAQPIPGTPEALRFKAVATSSDRTCALLTDGTPLCWGRPYDTRPRPSIPEGPFENIYGGFHFCATTSEGTAQCWDFAEAGNHVCTHVDEDPVARYCYGVDQPESSDNEGLIDKSSVYVPAWYYDQTPPEGEQFVKLAPGRDHTCGLRQDNTHICWGDLPEDVRPSDDAKFVDIVSGSHFSCGISTDQQTLCWGWERRVNFHRIPVDDDFASVATTNTSDYSRTCGIDATGLVTCVGVPMFCIPNALYVSPCWRIQFDEDPGYSYDVNQPTPYNPAPGHTFASLSTEAPECGIKADGTALCWHPWGSVGSPPTTETFTQISAGTRHVCGIRTDGTIACWGDNFYGQATPPNGDHIQTEQSLQPQYSDIIARR